MGAFNRVFYIVVLTRECCRPSVKQKTKEYEELVASLKEQAAALTSERDSEHKNSERLKSKYTQLKSAEELRAHSLDEERQAVLKAREAIRAQLLENNDKLRHALLTIEEYKQKHDIHHVPSGKDSAHDDHTSHELHEAKAKISALEAQMTSLDTKAINATHHATTMEKERTKMAEELHQTLQEFKKIDDYAQTLSAQFDEMKLWVDTFEQWNQGACCPSCHNPMDIGTIIDRRVEERKKSDLAASAPAILPTGEVLHQN